MPTINPIRQRVAWLVSVLAAGGFLAAAMTGATHADSERKASRVALPVIHIEKGEECVEPEEVMRRDHMNLILHQRDKTMHQGIRTAKHSFKNCVDCHADPKTNSVQGQDGFCSSCHEYASVKIDCFSCHTDKRDKNAVAVAPFKGTAAKVASP